jgi:hypothetical protein
MEPDGPLSCPQEPYTGLYAEPHYLSLYDSILFI